MIIQKGLRLYAVGVFLFAGMAGSIASVISVEQVLFFIPLCFRSYRSDGIPMPEDSALPHTPARASGLQDVTAGATLGALLGWLMGMSTAPVVAIVIGGLVALLGATFGLVDSKVAALSHASARRLTAFGLAALLVTPAGVWIRTHQLLGPSIKEQIAMLDEMGVPPGRARHDLLMYLRFGAQVQGAGAAPSVALSIPPTFLSSSGLYATHTSFCEQLAELKTTRQESAEYRRLFARQDALKNMSIEIAALPEPQQRAVFESSVIFLCPT